MASVSERIVQHFQVRREVSQTPDLAILLLARLVYDPPPRLPAAVATVIRRMREHQLVGVDGNRTDAFADWLAGYLTINETARGVSLYPVHPALTLSTNGEGARVEPFTQALARCFTDDERRRLIDALWSDAGLPPIERTLRDLIAWQLPDGEVAPHASASRFEGSTANALPHFADGILVCLKEDLLGLATVTTSIQAFVTHAGRLLAFALSRYLLAVGEVDFELPIYAAPAADSHAGVRTLAHEIIEVHRAQLAESLHGRFQATLAEEMAALATHGDPPEEAAARDLVPELFHYNANIVPVGQYDRLLAEHGSFSDLTYHYYWTHSGSTSRFLRQLHTAHLNLAKKAGFACSRSQYSQWHYYSLAPSLVESLLLISRPRLKDDRVLLATLLAEWRDRYGIAVLVDDRWADAYRRYFRGLGSPEALNEANLRRFTEILADRGRLHKNSDDFPWVVLKD